MHSTYLLPIQKKTLLGSVSLTLIKQLNHLKLFVAFLIWTQTFRNGKKYKICASSYFSSLVIYENTHLLPIHCESYFIHQFRQQSFLSGFFLKTETKTETGLGLRPTLYILFLKTGIFGYQGNTRPMPRQ